MAATFKVEIDLAKLQQLRDQSPQKAGIVLRKLALEGEGYIKNSFTVSPSSPGEPPGVDTGTLKNSIKAEKLDTFSWAIGTKVDYAPFLEFGTTRMAPRPFMGPAARYLGDISGKFFDGFLEK